MQWDYEISRYVRVEKRFNSRNVGMIIANCMQKEDAIITQTSVNNLRKQNMLYNKYYITFHIPIKEFLP